jgi:dolichol-phosphate mannosyltransferase
LNIGEKDKMITVIIPTYNEKENIEKIITEIKKNVKDIRILIVDDDSPDGTGKIVDRLTKKDKKIEIIHRKGKLGLGSAYIRGFKHVLKNHKDSDLIMSMDCDFSHNPKYMPSLIKKINQGYDVVLGSRYVKGGGIKNWDITRRIMSRGANLLARIILNIKINDVTGAFRCYKREVLNNINLNKIKSNGYSFLEELLYYCKKKNYKIGETPIIFVDRKEGVSKLSKIEMVNFFLTLIKLRFS